MEGAWRKFVKEREEDVQTSLENHGGK